MTKLDYEPKRPNARRDWTPWVTAFVIVFYAALFLFFAFAGSSLLSPDPDFLD